MREYSDSIIFIDISDKTLQFIFQYPTPLGILKSILTTMIWLLERFDIRFHGFTHQYIIHQNNCLVVLLQTDRANGLFLFHVNCFSTPWYCLHTFTQTTFLQELIESVYNLTLCLSPAVLSTTLSGTVFIYPATTIFSLFTSALDRIILSSLPRILSASLI